MSPINPIAFPPLQNDTLIKAIKNEKIDKIPVWIMRQAGRFLPEFREFRSKHDFFEICQTPELACEVTLMPIKRFPLDAAIIFSDILLIPQCLGIIIEMKDKQGIVIQNPLTSPNDINKLVWPKIYDNQDKEPSEASVPNILSNVYKAIELTRMKLNGQVPLIGFVGAPWTLMGYMIDGGSSTTFMKARSWLYKYPEESLNFLQKLTELIGNHLINQAKHGAQVLQVFESHGECLNRQLFQKFCAPFLKTIADMVKSAFEGGEEKPPLILFVKGSHHSLPILNSLGYEVISLDWSLDPSEARKILGPQQCLQGNLDPSALFSSKETLQNLTCDMISRFGTKGYIANLGHGIYPDTPLDSVAQFIETVHSYPTNL